uniref:Putative ovule protein n=1 Tax=Solanum chacoense TaxID=4108 RepID=A0A0V0GXS5_SOLCH
MNFLNREYSFGNFSSKRYKQHLRTICLASKKKKKTSRLLIQNTTEITSTTYATGRSPWLIFNECLERGNSVQKLYQQSSALLPQ